MGFVVDKVALGKGFSPSISVCPCQYHSSFALYLLLPKLCKLNTDPGGLA